MNNKRNYIKTNQKYRPRFQTLIRELDADLRIRNGALMDVYKAYNIIEAIETVVIVYLDNIPPSLKSSDFG